MTKETSHQRLLSPGWAGCSITFYEVVFLLLLQGTGCQVKSDADAAFEAAFNLQTVSRRAGAPGLARFRVLFSYAQCRPERKTCSSCCKPQGWLLHLAFSDCFLLLRVCGLFSRAHQTGSRPGIFGVNPSSFGFAVRPHQGITLRRTQQCISDAWNSECQLFRMKKLLDLELTDGCGWAMIMRHSLQLLKNNDMYTCMHVHTYTRTHLLRNIIANFVVECIIRAQNNPYKLTGKIGWLDENFSAKYAFYVLALRKVLM